MPKTRSINVASNRASVAAEEHAKAVRKHVAVATTLVHREVNRSVSYVSTFVRTLFGRK